jgi:Reverse transcriptase (RNA-dependent DNA polymerase)
VHGFLHSKPNSQIPSIRGSNIGENSTSLADDTIYHTEFNDAAFVTIQGIDGDPKSLEEAKSQTDWPRWKEAIDIELKTVEGTGTWEEVPRPPDKNIIDCKLVFKIKRKANSTILKYKAHLVAHGFTQIYSVDYFETYSPIMRLASFRTIIALTARNNWDINSFNFNSAYLNGKLDENKEIYMQFPSKYKPQGKNMILRLRKTLYGLKQAGRHWYDSLSHALNDLGFRASHANPGVFHTQFNGKELILVIHVDDCTFTGPLRALLDEYK